MKNQYILAQKYNDHRTSHVLHLLLSIISMGLWVPVWVLVTLSNAIERRRLAKLMER